MQMGLPVCVSGVNKSSLTSASFAILATLYIFTMPLLLQPLDVHNLLQLTNEKIEHLSVNGMNFRNIT
ncbi:hypothetical protein CW304_00410 [Bacillus sp. UFRGS-B20]|nr:hypothetical protein CW304_00410 [Bacillus sp. UFRGS-B20]